MLCFNPVHFVALLQCKVAQLDLDSAARKITDEDSE